MNTRQFKVQKSNSFKALFITLAIHALFIGGIIYGTGSNALSSKTTANSYTSKKISTKTTKSKSKYYNAAKSLKNRK